MLNEIKEIMYDYYEITDINLDSNFKTDFGLTSFDFVNLMGLIENKYDIVLEEKDYRKLNTIRDLIVYLEEKKCNYL